MTESGLNKSRSSPLADVSHLLLTSFVVTHNTTCPQQQHFPELHATHCTPAARCSDCTPLSRSPRSRGTRSIAACGRMECTHCSGTHNVTQCFLCSTHTVRVVLRCTACPKASGFIFKSQTFIARGFVPIVPLCAPTLH